jgi:hypothetical protein
LKITVKKFQNLAAGFGLEVARKQATVISGKTENTGWHTGHLGLLIMGIYQKVCTFFINAMCLPAAIQIICS